MSINNDGSQITVAQSSDITLTSPRSYTITQLFRYSTATAVSTQVVEIIDYCRTTIPNLQATDHADIEYEINSGPQISELTLLLPLAVTSSLTPTCGEIQYTLLDASLAPVTNGIITLSKISNGQV